MKTQAAVLFETNRPLHLIDIELPPLAEGQVLVEVAYSGVCHTQLGEVRGKRGPDRFLPHTLGHEGAGTVVEVGPGVAKVRPGDRVVLSWIKGSGRIVPSVAYGSEQGAINSGALSTFMRRTVTCEACVTPIPSAMPLREAALLGCAVPTGGGIVANTVRLAAGQSIAIFGMGGIGASAALAAAAVGAEPIIAVDVVEEKLAEAKRCGATHTINAAAEKDVVAAILAVTGNRGVDCAIEAAGRVEAMEGAFRSVRNGGGLCVIAGNVEPGRQMRVDPYDLIRGKRLVGTWGGETDMDRDVPQYVEGFLAGKLPLSQLISGDYGLERINELLDDLEQGRIVRGVIDMSL